MTIPLSPMGDDTSFVHYKPVESKLPEYKPGSLCPVCQKTNLNGGRIPGQLNVVWTWVRCLCCDFYWEQRVRTDVTIPPE